MKADFLSGPPASKTRLPKLGHFSNGLDDFQRHAVRFVLETKTVGLFAEQGTGKTWISLSLVEQLLTDDFAGLLIVFKNNKETTWFDNAAKLRGVEVTGDWEQFKQIRGPRLLIVHYEQMTKMISKLVRFGHRWTAIIVDELHRCKNRGSKSSRCVARLREFGRYRLGLTGTPLEQQPQDVWAQMKFINVRVFGEKWKHFDRRYLERTGYGGYKRKFKQKRWGEFIKKLQPHCIRIEKGVLGLKPMHDVVHKLGMDEDQRTIYDSMKKRNKVKLPTGEWLRAPLTMVRNMRLSQIAGGFLQTDDGYYWVGSPKVRRLMGILKTCPHPVVVFVRFVPELIELERRLNKRGVRVATYYGKTKDKPAVQRSFQAGEVDVMIVQVRSGGVGLDLFTARTAIAYSGEWSSITFDQVRARVHRRGQQHELDFHHLIVKKSIDVRKHKRIHSKLSMTKKTLDNFRR